MLAMDLASVEFVPVFPNPTVKAWRDLREWCYGNVQHTIRKILEIDRPLELCEMSLDLILPGTYPCGPIFPTQVADYHPD